MNYYLLVIDTDTIFLSVPYFQTVEDSFQSGIRSGENAEHSSNGHQDGRIPYPYNSSINEPSEVHAAGELLNASISAP